MSGAFGIYQGCIGAIGGWLCCIEKLTCAGEREYFSGHYQRYGLNIQVIWNEGKKRVVEGGKQCCLTRRVHTTVTNNQQHGFYPSTTRFLPHDLFCVKNGFIIARKMNRGFINAPWLPDIKM